MINVSQDIQASYQIIQLIEKSKNNSELIIDTLPDIFLVIDEKGKIFKANQEACKFLSLDPEQALGYSLASSFLPENWQLIEGNFLTLKEGKKSNNSFELPVIFEGTERNYLFSVSAFGEFTDKQLNQTLKLYTLQGRDITLLRLYQKKINDIFASIPLGIFTVNNLGVIDDAFSEYTKWMLGRSSIAAKTLKELLYEPAKELMDVATREGFKALMDSVNRSLREFDLLSDTFPKQFFYPLEHSVSEKGRYLGIKVQSIARGDRVIGLLIILEDRTLIVEAEKADERGQLLQDQSIERAIQIKRADPDILEIAFQDLNRLFTELGDCLLTQSSDSFKNVLHSIKSNARLAGLSNLQKLTHSFETKLKEDTIFSWEVAYSNMEPLMNEWREIVGLYKVLTHKNNTEEKKTGYDKLTTRSVWQMYKESSEDSAHKKEFEQFLKDLSVLPLGSMEPVIRGVCGKASEATNKRVKMLFNWSRDLQLDIDLLSDIRTCLTHIVNNAVDHAIESTIERSEKGKSSTGLIHIGSIHSEDAMIIFVEDDGRGLNRDQIQAKALKQGLISQDQCKIFSNHDIFDLIFYDGFSTRDQATDLSGRGVGLAAVREICTNRGGNCKVAVGPTGLTRFELHFVMQE